MRTTFDSYKARSGRLDLRGIDFDDFKVSPLQPEALRSLRYMHDVEHHTVCYLRDLLLTPAHQDPNVTSFLSCWVFEEIWHGEAIGRVLEAHGEVAGAPRVAALRQGHRRRSGVMPKREVGFLANYLFAREKGKTVLERIDRRVDRLPGQGELHLLQRAVASVSSSTKATPAA